MIGRIVRSTDFERVLRTRSRASSAHFALHHLAAEPGKWIPRSNIALVEELSTDNSQVLNKPVDDSVLQGVWMGAVVPKRHARRAVTRTLIKRQIRAAMARHAQTLPSGLWVVRLRSPFDRKQFVSAASDALKGVARAELEQVLSTLQRSTAPR